MTAHPYAAVSSSPRPHLLAIQASRLVVLVGMLFTIPTISTAGPMGAPGSGDGLQAAAERELVRRQQLMLEAEEAILLGDQAMKNKDYEAAVELYRRAYDILPDSLATENLRNQALDKYSQASVELAKQRILEGQYDEATAIAEEVLEVNPVYRPAVRLLAQLEDPEWYNRMITPDHIADVQRVSQLLLEAEQSYAIGKFELAILKADQVLNIDPTNNAARKIQEEVYNEMQRYGVNAYAASRARRLAEVSMAWETPPTPFASQEPIGREDDIEGADAARIRLNNEKLDRIILPSVAFRDTTVREAIDFLRQQSIARDTVSPPDQPKGINIVLDIQRSGAGAGPAPGAPAAPS
ncbi:MAG: tetratricopeptide repeat protein, partial [Verrucomicrobiales bacterium]